MDDFRNARLPLLGNLEGEGHERRRVAAAEHLRADGVEHARAERAPALAEFDLFVDTVGDAGGTRAAEDRAAAEGARAELHAALEPGDRIAVDEYLGDVLRYVVNLAPLRLRRMSRTGSDHVLVAVGRTEVDMLHLLDRNAACDRYVRGSTDGRARIARCRLHKQFLDVRAGDDLLIQLDVQRAAAGKGQPAGLLEDVAEVILDHLQREILEQLLHARRVVDVRVVGDVAVAHRAEPVDQFRREVEAPAFSIFLLLVATEADHVGVVGVDDQLAVLEFRQPREVVFGRVAVGCHAHHLVFAVEHLEAEVFGECAVEAAERIRIVELLDLADLAVLADAEEGGCILALAIDAEDRCFLGKA